MGEFFAEYGMVLFWAAIAVLTLIVEACTEDMVSIWFLPGAFLALIVAFWVHTFWIQLLIFLVVSIILLAVTRRYFKKHPFLKKGEPMNAEAIIGEKGVVLEEIDNIRQTGSVKIRGLVWTAFSDDGSVIPKDTVVEITKIAGVKAYCKIVDTSGKQ